MGANLCKDLDMTKKRFISDRDDCDKKKTQLPPLFTKSNKVSSLRNLSKLNHTKSNVSERDKNEFQEELNCSICSTKDIKKVDTNPNDIEINETPVAWMEECCSRSIDIEGESIKQIMSTVNTKTSHNKIHDNYFETSNSPKQRLNQIRSEGCATNGGISSNITTDNVGNGFHSIQNEMAPFRNRSITPFEKKRNSSEESIFGSIDGKEFNLTENHSDHHISELGYSLQTEVHYRRDEKEGMEIGNYVKNLSANVMLSSRHYSRKGKEKCGFCDFVANGRHGRWNELDGDVTKLMDTIDKLSSLLIEKEMSLSPDSVNDKQLKELNEKKLKEKVIELRNKKRIGISLQKTSLGKRLIIFKDGKNTYQIEGKTKPSICLCLL